jgi:hypothetical protein
MSKFQITQAQKVVFTTQDGKQFEDAAVAEAHQFGLENGEKLDLGVDSYLNKFGYKNRSRMQKATIAREFYSFFLAWDGTAIARSIMDDEVVAKEDVISADDVPTAAVEVEGTIEAAPQAAQAPADEDDLF